MMANAISIRSGASITTVTAGTRANLLLPIAIAAALGLQFAGLYLPLLQDLLHTQPLSLPELAAVCALSFLGYAAIRLDRVLFRGPQPGRVIP